MLDFASFSAPVRFSEIRSYAKANKDMDIVSGVFMVFFIVLVLVLVFATLGWGPAATTGMVFGIFFGGSALFVVAAYARQVYKGVRLQRFAQANGFSYLARQPNTREAGSIFEIGSDRHTDRMVGGMYNNRPFWFGTHYYTIGSGKSRRTITVGVLNVTLPRAVPHVIIDGRQNRVHPAQGLVRSQRLELEGDFNKYFTIYCPKDYERDVLYFLTPELMQQLIDMDDKFDIEMVGTELYFYRQTEMPAKEPAVKELFGLMTQLTSEVVENTQRYQDWRIDKHIATIAPSGLKLQKSIWPAILAVIFTIIYTVLSIIK